MSSQLAPTSRQHVLVIEPATPGPLTPFANMLTSAGYDVVILSGALRDPALLPKGARFLGFRDSPAEQAAGLDPVLGHVEIALQRAQVIAQVARTLLAASWVPDLILGLGDGTTHLLGDVFPAARTIVHVDRYLPAGTDGIFEAGTGARVEARLHRRVDNVVGLLAAVHADWSVCPLPSARASFPAYLHPRMSVTPPAVDIEFFSPSPSSAQMPGVGRESPAVVVHGRTADPASTTWAVVLEIARVAPLAQITVVTPDSGEVPESVGAAVLVEVRPTPAKRRSLARSAAVVLCTDSADVWPVPLVEALACGAIVVAAITPTTSALIEHGTSGYLVEGSDPTAHAHAAGWVLANLATQDNLRSAGRASAVRFGLAQTTETYQRLVAWVLAGGAGPIRPHPFRPHPFRPLAVAAVDPSPVGAIDEQITDTYHEAVSAAG